MKIIIHIGMGKTGSTSIQNTLADHRDTLRERGVNYSTIMGARDCQIRFPIRMLHGEDRQALLRDAMRNPDMYEMPEDGVIDEAFAREMDGTHTTIVSAENLFRTCSSPERTRIVADYVGRSFDDVRIVAYLRRQDVSIASRYAQRVKGGHVPEASLEETARRDMESYDYAATLSPWAETFGDQAITVRPFEKGQLAGGDAVLDFLDVVGLSDILDGRTPLRENDSFSAEATAFVRHLNNHLPQNDVSVEARRMRRHVRSAGLAFSQGCARPVLPAALAREIVERFRDTNAEVARRYLGRTDGRLFHEEPSTEDDERARIHVSTDRAAELTSDILRQMMADQRDLREQAERLRQTVRRQGDASLHQQAVLARRQDVIVRQQRTIEGLRATGAVERAAESGQEPDTPPLEARAGRAGR